MGGQARPSAGRAPRGPAPAGAWPPRSAALATLARSPALAALVAAAMLAAACAAPGSAARLAGTSATPTASAPTPSPTVSPSPQPRSFSLVAAGDVLIHSPVTARAADYGGGDGYDFAPMLRPVAPLISAADLAVCHLEVPLSADNSRLRGYPRFSAPRELAGGLAAAGFDACSVASNHALDQGPDGVRQTLDVLDTAGVDHAGAARTADESGPSLYQAGGVTVGHLSYTYGLNGLRLPAGQPWLVNLIDRERVVADAAAARAAGAEFVVVSLHWGAEYRSDPTDRQHTLALALLASPDIDLLLGHHAHVVQPVEPLAGGYVAYGLGNLLSNQTRRLTRDGVVVRFDVAETPGGRLAVQRVSFAPTWVDRATHRVLPAARFMTDRSVPQDVRAELARSLQRTVEAVTRRGAGEPAVWGDWPGT